MRWTYFLGWVAAVIGIAYRMFGFLTPRLPAQLQYDWKAILEVSVFLFVACIATATYAAAKREPEKGKSKGAAL